MVDFGAFVTLVLFYVGGYIFLGYYSPSFRLFLGIGALIRVLGFLKLDILSSSASGISC